MTDHYQINLRLIYSRSTSFSNLLDVTLKVTRINESQGGGGGWGHERGIDLTVRTEINSAVNKF